MKKIILLILTVFAGFTFAFAEKVPRVGLTAPSPDLIPRIDKVLKNIAGTQSEFGNVDTGMLYLSTATMEEHDAFPLSSFVHFNDKNAETDSNATTSNNEINAYLQTVLFKPIEKAKYLSSFVNTDKERPEYDVIYYISASNTDANDTALNATTTLIENIKVTYLSSTYNTDKERTPYDAIYYTSVVAADKYAKPTMKTAIIVTKNIQSAKGHTHTDGKILSSFNSLIAISDNAEIKYETKIGPMNADVFAYNPYAVIIGKDPSSAGSEIKVAFGHSDYGA